MSTNSAGAAHPSETSPANPLRMPGPPQQAADDIERKGVEGRPADPAAGPGFLWWELVVAALVVFSLVGVIGWALGWAAGIAALAFAAVAFVLNPQVLATVLRARDRRAVARDQSPEPHTSTDGPPFSGPPVT